MLDFKKYKNLILSLAGVLFLVVPYATAHVSAMSLNESQASDQVANPNEPQSSAVITDTQDVRTNPQSEVGGIDAANGLFRGEELGRQPESIGARQINWRLIVLISLGVLLCLFSGLLLVRKRRNKDDTFGHFL